MKGGAASGDVQLRAPAADTSLSALQHPFIHHRNHSCQATVFRKMTTRIGVADPVDLLAASSCRWIQQHFLLFLSTYIFSFASLAQLFLPPSEALTCESNLLNTAKIKCFEIAAGLWGYIFDVSIYAAHADDLIPASVTAFPPALLK